MAPIYHMYLTGKILGKAIPMKFIMTKCTLGRKVSGEVSLMDMGNGFSFVKFSNEVEDNRVDKGDRGSLVVKFSAVNQKDFDPIKEPLPSALL